MHAAPNTNACDRFTAGYGAAKLAHERVMLSGPIPARVLRLLLTPMAQNGLEADSACRCGR